MATSRRSSSPPIVNAGSGVESRLQARGVRVVPCAVDFAVSVHSTGARGVSHSLSTPSSGSPKPRPVLGRPQCPLNKFTDGGRRKGSTARAM